jgi:hypothetical protein
MKVEIATCMRSLHVCTDEAVARAAVSAFRERRRRRMRTAIVPDILEPASSTLRIAIPIGEIVA